MRKKENWRYMVISFFISIITLIAIVLFTINPITRAVNNSIAKHNLAVEKRRLKEEKFKRIENEIKAIRMEAEELREKLKLEAEINDELSKVSTELNSRKTLKEITPEVIIPFLDGYKDNASEDEDEFDDWGLDDPVGLRRKGKWLD